MVLCRGRRDLGYRTHRLSVNRCNGGLIVWSIPGMTSVSVNTSVHPTLQGITGPQFGT